MSEELRKELKNINKQILEARESYKFSASNGHYNKNIYNRIIELENSSSRNNKSDESLLLC